jgi:hypothetical protein
MKTQNNLFLSRTLTTNIVFWKEKMVSTNDENFLRRQSKNTTKNTIPKCNSFLEEALNNESEEKTRKRKRYSIMMSESP